MFTHSNNTLEKKVKELREHYKRTLITKREAARELGGISSSTLDRMRKDGLISTIKVRGRVMISILEIARII